VALSADPYAAGCRSRQVIDRIGDRWTVLLLGALSDGPKRFTELARRVEGISQKMLTQTLRGLERDGMVSRTVYATVPVRVDYELTDLGATLLETTRALVTWTEAHQDEVAAARTAYDAREAADADLTSV
jgi:DNA-binding HxlR family transcriptional regulator